MAVDIETSGSIMATSAASTPPPDRGYEKSDTADPATSDQAHHIVTPTDFAGSVRCRTNDRVDNGELTTVEAGYFYALADFCQQHNCFPCHNVVGNFFNFGEFDVLFEDADGPGHWMSMIDLGRISGMEPTALDDLFEEELADGSTQVAELKWMVNGDGDYNIIRVARHPFCMLAMAEGPWAAEFMKNMAPLFRRAMVETGLAKELGSVAILHDDGTLEQTDVPFEEFLGERLVDEDEARRQAFAGPLGGVL